MEWWKGAVCYQIYPRSFCDSSGNGVGDLAGIESKLDYIADLGVDCIWLSPFFESPMVDFGYDISDHKAVDPLFGSVEGFRCLCQKARSLGLKIIVDQVLSHTSDQHSWFKQSSSNRLNEKSDWYVWADPKADGSPPNNWQSVFGGSSWSWSSSRQQYYLHNYYTQQPDLNLHNAEVQEKLLEIPRFWLECGVDGFRLDAVHNFYSDAQLRDNPAAVNPNNPRLSYDYQQHIYNEAQPEVIPFLKRFRAVLNEGGGSYSVAEVDGENSLELMRTYADGQDTLHTAYNFSFLHQLEFNPLAIRKTIELWEQSCNGAWPSWAFSNHDVCRVRSRWQSDHDCTNDEESEFGKTLLALLLCFKGNAFIYQGEELGLPQAEIPFECLVDPEAIANWPNTLGRDGARTPMPWNADQDNAGFSCSQPWLPIDPRHIPMAVNQQIDDDDSFLNFTKKMIKLRKQYSALGGGDIVFHDTDNDVLMFDRISDEDTVRCILNLGSEDKQFELNRSTWIILETGLRGRLESELGLVPAFSGLLMVKSSSVS